MGTGVGIWSCDRAVTWRTVSTALLFCLDLEDGAPAAWERSICGFVSLLLVVRFPASSSSWPSGKNKPWTASPPEAGKQTLWTLLEESLPVKAGHGRSKPVLGEEASAFKGMPSLGRGTRIHLSSHWEVAFKKKKTSERAYWFKNICHINMSFISALKIISLLYFWNS